MKTRILQLIVLGGVAIAPVFAQVASGAPAAEAGSKTEPVKKKSFLAGGGGAAGGAVAVAAALAARKRRKKKAAEAAAAKEI